MALSCDDFIVTIHALERFHERFPDLAEPRTDREQGELIHKEVMAALDAGRHAKVPPIELACHGAERWEQRNPGAYIVWNEGKTRGYAVVEDEKEGMLVLTVLVGEEREVAMRKLRKLRPRTM